MNANTTARLTSCVGAAALQALLPLLQMMSIVVTIYSNPMGPELIPSSIGKFLRSPRESHTPCMCAQRRTIISSRRMRLWASGWGTGHVHPWPVLFKTPTSRTLFESRHRTSWLQDAQCQGQFPLRVKKSDLCSQSLPAPHCPYCSWPRIGLAGFVAAKLKHTSVSAHLLLISSTSHLWKERVLFGQVITPSTEFIPCPDRLQGVFCLRA